MRLSAAYAHKGYQFQSTGLTEKFKCFDDLASFVCEVKENMDNSCGLYTITYLPNPTDKKSMCRVLMDYSKYTTNTARLAGTLKATKYDAYDKVNDKAATKFVLSSHNKELKETLHICISSLNICSMYFGKSLSKLFAQL
jgi:hypothetical protein